MLIVDTWLTPECVPGLLKVDESLEHPFGHECKDLPHALGEER